MKRNYYMTVQMDETLRGYDEAVYDLDMAIHDAQMDDPCDTFQNVYDKAYYTVYGQAEKLFNAYLENPTDIKTAAYWRGYQAGLAAIRLGGTATEESYREVLQNIRVQWRAMAASRREQEV